ncbi:MAG: hypothetical protein QGF90_18445 [Gammaproteobacteria bacterium]|jgi:hypothetical protein|nr:hypothetical protein [Gammaproteobacteria bacterium]|tara:strand:+ start:258 stop:449 length:192 start_codon:yes stop_codon:yes gene_type:complete
MTSKTVKYQNATEIVVSEYSDRQENGTYPHLSLFISIYLFSFAEITVEIVRTGRADTMSEFGV